MDKPNLIIKITPDRDVDGFDFDIVENTSGLNFEYMLKDDPDFLAIAIDDLKLTNKRKPYLLKFYDAAIGREEEYEYDYPSGNFYSTFEFKSAKVGRVKK